MLFQGNVVIVDTPGIGDQEQEEVASMMMDYIPNALAFVFVVNVQSAGGLQTDRVRF
jgi:predicted GTPase